MSRRSSIFIRLLPPRLMPRSKATYLGILDIDHKPVAHVRLDRSVVGRLDVIRLDDLDLGLDAVLGAEIEHLLCLGNAADQRARDGLVAKDQPKGMHAVRARRHADHYENTANA